jgi:aspartyl protease family protein
MYFMAWIAGLALLTVLFSGIAERKVNPNQSPNARVANGVTEVVLKQNRKGHYVTTGTINGQEVVFLLDTGATDVSVPAHIAEKVNMSKGRPINVMTANGMITAYQSWIAEIGIDELLITDVDANINPAVKDDFILLGMSALKRLEFTQRGDTLTLRSYQ